MPQVVAYALYSGTTAAWISAAIAAVSPSFNYRSRFLETAEAKERR